MPPAATVASSLRLRSEQARLAINGPSPAALAARRARCRLDYSARAAARLPGAPQQQRRHACAISVADQPRSLAEILGAQLQPETDAPPQVADSSRPRPRDPPRPPFDLALPSSSKTIEYIANLRLALRTRESDNVLRCLVAGAHDAAFVSSIPPTTFTELLRLVSSSCEREELQDTLEQSWWMRNTELPSRNKSMARFLQAAQITATIRRRTNVALSLVDYKLLLKCAASIADKSVARDLWRHLEEDELTPDTECYNAYLHAVLWGRQLAGHKRSWTNPLSFRVDGYYLSARRMQRLSYAPSLGGYEMEARALIDRLLQQAHLGDETTILHLITAFAREGNIAAVKDTLKRVWNIRVDELMASGRQHSTPKSFPPSAPLQPTRRLLYTVAHAFGANSEVPTALRLTDFISSSYGLPIPTQVWSELLVWTYVQSSIRSGRFKRMHRTANKLPLDAPENLWQTLVHSPYNVSPSMKMFHMSINNLTKSQRYDIVAQRIREGIQLYREDLEKARASVQRFAQAKRDVAKGRSPKHSLSSLQSVRNAKVAAVQRDHTFIRRWCQMYTARGNGYGFMHEFQQDDGQVGLHREVMYETIPDWATRDVPNFLSEFRKYCPRVVKYRTHTGVVELELRPMPPTKTAARNVPRDEETKAAEDFWERRRNRFLLNRLLAGARRLPHGRDG